ncbi:MAG TPA: tRNA epoxyqueuosine(34) reductase QueG [Lacipirellulaceae bacterium]|jgi:epoxyqueuosine reductase|nr:tRNA epoxyqueuosine(34) reductase QueG [Lacipirellulaceae bacterium]
MDLTAVTNAIKQRACELGFSLCGAHPAVSPSGATRLDEWLAAGYAGQMKYLANRREAYGDPNRVLDGVRSILMLAMNYRTAEPVTASAGQGRVSRYAWGEADYHDVIDARLKALGSFLQELQPGARTRGVVDTAPLLEREFAELAGLGWIGKNTLLINRREGSWFFLSALLTNIELEYENHQETDHCGTCRACLDACPTNAFPQAYVLDASRCISYLTIELRDSIPSDLRRGMGNWLFGCDVCQDVCPWNSRATLSNEAEFEPRESSNPLDLIELFYLDDAEFRARFRHTPLWRPRRRGLLRNAAIVLGNHPSPIAIPALARGLNDDEPLIRGACAWALGRQTTGGAVMPLNARLQIEADAEVVQEIQDALSFSIDGIVENSRESTA